MPFAGSLTSMSNPFVGFQVEQLVSFLQVPIQTNSASSKQLISSRSSKMSFSSFQPSGKQVSQSKSGAQSAESLRELAISTFNTNYSVSPQRDWVSPQGTASLLDDDLEADSRADPRVDVWDYSNLREWPGSRQFMDDDDFFTLGFRPQDEITTEL